MSQVPLFENSGCKKCKKSEKYQDQELEIPQQYNVQSYTLENLSERIPQNMFYLILFWYQAN